MIQQQSQNIELGSGNVFADLGLPQPEQHLAKAELALKIIEVIRARELTQAEAAQVLGIDQPKVSALMRGRLRGFSLDRLLRFLNLLGSDVDIVITAVLIRDGMEAGSRSGRTSRGHPWR